MDGLLAAQEQSGDEGNNKAPAAPRGLTRDLKMYPCKPNVVILILVFSTPSQDGIEKHRSAAAFSVTGQGPVREKVLKDGCSRG